MIVFIILSLIIQLSIILGSYLIGLKIWDFYYDKIIIPKKKEIKRQRMLKFLEVCDIIGNPKIIPATLI